MTFTTWVQGLWTEFLTGIQNSSLLHGATTAGIILAAVAGMLGTLVLTTFLLRRYFKRRPFIDRAHRGGVYLLTMLGVFVLLLGAILGALLPIIPGVVFLLLAMVLLRKYHKNRWVETKIRYLQFRLRVKRALKRHLKKHRKPDTKKGLSTRLRPKKKR
jgi:hypothetical protein